MGVLCINGNGYACTIRTCRGRIGRVIDVICDLVQEIICMCSLNKYEWVYTHFAWYVDLLIIFWHAYGVWMIDIIVEFVAVV